MPAPEALARIDIDRLLEDAGWVVQNRDQINIYAGEGIAVREAYIPNVGEADYLSNHSGSSPKIRFVNRVYHA